MPLAVIHEQYSWHGETGCPRRRGRDDGLRLDGGRRDEHGAAGYDRCSPTHRQLYAVQSEK